MKRRGTCLEIYLETGQTLNPIPIIEFDGITLYDMRFLKKGFIKRLTELQVYFYFNKVPYLQKVGLITHKLYYDAREW
jgi:hypothetical protein